MLDLECRSNSKPIFKTYGTLNIPLYLQFALWINIHMKEGIHWQETIFMPVEEQEDRSCISIIFSNAVIKKALQHLTRE